MDGFAVVGALDGFAVVGAMDGFAVEDGWAVGLLVGASDGAAVGT